MPTLVRILFGLEILSFSDRVPRRVGLWGLARGGAKGALAPPDILGFLFCLLKNSIN